MSRIFIARELKSKTTTVASKAIQMIENLQHHQKRLNFFFFKSVDG